MYAQTVILVVVAAFSCNGNKLPSTFKRCRISVPEFNSCLREAIQNAIRETGHGVPSLGLPPIDPMEVVSIYLGHESRPVDISLEFNNIKITGFTSLHVESLEFDPSDLRFDLKVKILEPLNLHGDYKIEGKILVLPIVGNDVCNLTLSDVEAEVIISGEKYEKNGDTFMKITNFNFTFDTSKLHVDFRNLFNGDKALGDSMNTVLNENWKVILEEMKPVITRTFGEVFREVSNRIFIYVPFNEIFLP